MRILFWFRKDLRLDDNTGLESAHRDARGDVVPFYASEPEILSRPDLAATRVRFVLESLASLGAEIERAGSRLALDHGAATETVVRAVRAAKADAVYWNEEYEPALRRRDDAVEAVLREVGIPVRRFHDRQLVAPDAVATAAGTPFVVYSPFRRACEALPLSEPLARVSRLAAHELPPRELATLERLGFATMQERWPGGVEAASERLARFVAEGLATYGERRDVLSPTTTSQLSADLRFGTLSPRTIVAAAREAVEANRRLQPSFAKYLEQLRWRDFYAHVIYHHPHAETGAFRREYDEIEWQGAPEHLDAWQRGHTGYPVVDAGMRELAATGLMHNRARMVVASFLTKDLLLDWRLGERHFMTQLVDGDLANNNGGWQWAASTGTDPQPYFRIFNPTLQGERFDPDGAYVRRWVPELARLPARAIHQPWTMPPLLLAEAGVTLGESYPERIVDHAERRDRAVEMYRRVAKRA